MYSMVSLKAVEPHDLEEIAPTLRSVGYELQPTQMRPSVWEYESGESSSYHRHEEQEELYVVLEGRFDATIERGDDREVLELRERDYLLVPPESWRQLTAREDGRLLVVGAPNAPDDAITES